MNLLLNLIGFLFYQTNSSMRLKVSAIFIITALSALLITGHWRIHLHSSFAPMTFSFLSTFLCFLWAIIFFIISLNHTFIRKKLFLKTDRLGLSMLPPVILLNSLALFYENENHESSLCLQYIALNFVFALCFSFFTLSRSTFLHVNLLIRQIMWGLFYVVFGLLSLTCASNSVHHVAFSHGVPFVIYASLILILKRYRSL